MQIISEPIVLNNIEKEYTQLTSIEHRKKYAQFFTPNIIADLMCKWLLGSKTLKNVLEPAFGLGIFSRYLLNYRDNLTIKGFEIDPLIFEKSEKIFSDFSNVSLHLKDYMYNDWDKSYDGIICNPPYFKFHDYDNKNMLREIEDKIGCKLNGFTNLYTLFLLKSISQLNKNGRVAYIIPSEFLNADYGKLVKSYLIKNRYLRHVIVIDFDENVFADALTTASILLFANDDRDDVVRFSNVNNLNDLTKIEHLIKNYPEHLQSIQSIKFELLDPDIKWRAYYQTQNALKYENLVPFTHYGKVMRGIATGANNYFTFNLSKAKQFNIEKKYLMPCIGKAIDIKNSFFTNSDFEELQQNDKSVFLLNAVNSKNEFVESYVQKGVVEEIDKKFLTASRTPWYALENRPPAPIWVTVFNRNGLRFIRNEAGIANLTTFHCIYLNLFSEPKTDLLFAYLLTDVARQIFEDNRREYANGLQKFEPNDINKSKILNLDAIDKVTEKKILDNYYFYRQSVLEKMPNEYFLKEINQIFVDTF